MGNRLGKLLKKRDAGEVFNGQRSTSVASKDTVIIGDLTIFSRKILGNGFFGTVFEGRWCQKPCAVKVLSPLGQEFLTGLPITTQQDNVQEEALLKFKKECDFMKSYEHPNIVAYYSTVFYPECNLPVLVMELMQTSLRRYIHEGAVMSERIQVSLSCDIASALEFLHDKGLVHRDLCGDNILLNNNQAIPVAKVSDFGISRIIVKSEQLSHSLTALGHRPGYLPPEAFSIDPTDYDSSLDIFMFGVVMTQIANKVPTVDSYHQRQKLVSQLEDRFSLKPFIFQCLREKREDRPSASTLYLDLLSVLESPCSSRNTPSNGFNLERSVDNGQDSRTLPHELVEEDIKEKTPPEIDDDDDDDEEPPPPYSENDPIEDSKLDIEGDSTNNPIPRGTLASSSTANGAPISFMNSGPGEGCEMTSQSPQQQQKSSGHSHHNSWMPVSDEEDPALSKEFPDEDGHLFDIQLKKGQLGGLGLSDMANTTSQTQQAEENEEIKWGDVTLKVNDTCVIRMGQTQVQELLATATLNVKFMLLRSGGEEEVNNRL